MVWSNEAWSGDALEEIDVNNAGASAIEGRSMVLASW